jgi:hypothetical protein
LKVSFDCYAGVRRKPSPHIARQSASGRPGAVRRLPMGAKIAGEILRTKRAIQLPQPKVPLRRETGDKFVQRQLDPKTGSAHRPMHPLFFFHHQPRAPLGPEIGRIP